MVKRFVQLFFIIVGGTLGFLYIPDLLNLFTLSEGLRWLASPYIGTLIGAIILFFTTFWAVDYIVGYVRELEDSLVKVPVTDLLFGSVGLLVGLLIAFLIIIPLRGFNFQLLSTVLPIFLTILLGYLGFQVGFKKREELLNLFLLPAKLYKKENEEASERQRKIDIESRKEEIPKSVKILDTSVIIDGRIADISQTGFLEGTIVVPHFILEELQHIADSSDKLKRERGRRGLDVLNKIRKEDNIQVEIYDGDFEDIPEVDSKLVKLAKVLSGKVVTNDFNLNKVCEVQGVPVLNINDLSNAVKPVVIPGEEMNLHVIKEGKEKKQGLAYLDDGTMVVVEDGRNHIGQTVDLVVTSVLQTSAGRMIFTKMKQ